MTGTMLYVVAYDVPNDRRRTKLYKVLSGFGTRTQYSLFECFLTPRQLVQLRERVYRLIDDSEDSLRIYPLCEACLKRVESIGAAPPEDPPAFFV